MRIPSPANVLRYAACAAFVLAGGAATAQPTLLEALSSPNPLVPSDPSINRQYFGAAVAGVPDADGDGVEDLLVGAPDENGPNGNRYGAGRAYLYSGATGALLHALRSADDLDLREFGASVAGVPDLDGDGFGDLLVGAPSLVGGSVVRKGRAYVFSGATSALLAELRSPNEERFGEFGRAVAGVPDVDGDGFGDLLVGALGENEIGPFDRTDGRAYLFSGATRALLAELVSPNDDEASFFGGAVAGVPDVDGDGRGDLLVGATGDSPDGDPDSAGRAYLFSGATGVLVYELASQDPQEFGRFGAAVAGVPDADGDGFSDLLVGAPAETPEGSPSFAGRVYLFSSASGVLLETLTSPSPEFRGSFGSGVAGVPDVDGDGRGDLLIGAEGQDPGFSPTSAGRAYLFSGASGALLCTLASPDEYRLGSFGTGVAGVGDTDGDGRGDLLVGAPGEGADEPDAPYSEIGRAYLFSGDPAACAEDPLAVTITGDETVAVGDLLEFTVTIENTADTTVAGALVVDFVSPDGDVALSRVLRDSTLRPDRTFSESYRQRVRAGAEPGTWTVVARVEADGGASLGSDSFTVVVTPAPGAAAARVAGVETELEGVYPNPARGSTAVTFALAEPGAVRLAVYDVLGREVAVLVDGTAEAGRHEAVLDAAVLPAGTYLVRLEAGGAVWTERLTLIR